MGEKLSDIAYSYVREALDQVYSEDEYLIANRPTGDEELDELHHVGERAIVFRFAYYFQTLLKKDGRFSGYHLDCEYNRNGRQCKALPSFPKGVYPDVILHKRNSNDNNLLVMEFKSYWNKNQSKDYEKLRELTSLSGEYKYQLGVAVMIAEERAKASVVLFDNGAEIV